MFESDDIALLRQYAENGSETAFTTLVERHVNLVHSAALRRVGNAPAAEEITQAVFIILARKARGLSQSTVLTGWLYQTARLTAANLLRGEIRRQRREQEAFMQSTLNESDAAAWSQIAPILDDAMARLGERDRNALLLRFFENKDLRAVGAALGASEDAAKMRVNRALEKLRNFFVKRGITLSAAMIGGAVLANSVHAAPTGLSQTISATALAKGAAASTSTLTLVKGVLKLMAWTKAKTAIAVSAGILFAAGTTTVTVKAIQEHRTYPWQVPKADFGVLYSMPAAVKIVPTKFAENGNWCCDGSRGAMGIAQPLKEIIQIAYRQDQLHTVVNADLPTNRYDFIAKLVAPMESRKIMPQNKNWATELQKEITKKFGLAGRLEMRETRVLALQPGSTGTHGFKVSHSMPDGRAMEVRLSGGCSFYEQPVEVLISFLQQRFQVPVVDQTGLKQEYDFSLAWDEPDPKHPNLDGLKQALHDQLGLELVLTNLPIEMLVVEKSK
jgi:uncharacterized protein (TIGR03435 family)